MSKLISGVLFLALISGVAFSEMALTSVESKGKDLTLKANEVYNLESLVDEENWAGKEGVEISKSTLECPVGKGALLEHIVVDSNLMANQGYYPRMRADLIDKEADWSNFDKLQIQINVKSNVKKNDIGFVFREGENNSYRTKVTVDKNETWVTAEIPAKDLKAAGLDLSSISVIIIGVEPDGRYKAGDVIDVTLGGFRFIKTKR